MSDYETIATTPDVPRKKQQLPWLRIRFKAAVGTLLDVSRLQSRLMSNCAVVVAFHRINDDYPSDLLTTTPEVFEGFCSFFRRHFEVIPLGELTKRLARGGHVEGTLSITFDDGYLDNHDTAAPILESFRLPATFFVTAGYLGTHRVAPWDRGLSPEPRWMAWDHVRSLQRRGFEIGAHTVEHVDLGSVSLDEAWQELAGARAMLEQQLDESVDLFAYPFGGPENIRDEMRPLVREAGFRICASCFGGVNYRHTDPMKLNRVPIGGPHATPHYLGMNLVRERTFVT